MSDIEEEEEGNQKKQTKSINFGSIISISHFQDNNAFIFTDGHVDSDVFLKNFGNQKEISSSNRGQSLLGRENFSSTLFLIYPKSSNTTKAEILELLNKDFSGNVLDTNKQVIPLDSDQAAQYQNKLLNEYKYNYDSFEKTRSTQLSYHQTIQLLHLNSGKFLACHQDVAEYQKENFRITLDNYTSENTMFQIIPAFKFQKDGDQVIWANEITWITRAIGIHNKTTYLHSSSEINEVMEHEKCSKDQDKQSQSVFQAKPPVTKDKTIKKREINASIEDPTSWKLNLFQEFKSQPDSFLRCGDVVWIHHSEANTIIGALRNSKGVDKYNFSSLNIDSWIAKENLVLNIQPSLTSTAYEDYSGNTFGMFMIDGKNQQEGGQIVFEKCYRFKHLSSGCYLSVILKEPENLQNSQNLVNQSKVTGTALILNKSNLTLPPIRKSAVPRDSQISPSKSDKPAPTKPVKDKGTYIIKLSTVADESTLFTFFQLKTDKMNAQNNFLESGKFTYIRHWKTGRYLDIGCNQGDLSQLTMKQKQQLRSTNFYPVMRQIRNESQLFKLYATTVDEIFEINYVLSCFRLLVTFVISLNKYEVKSSKDEDYLIILNQKIGLAKNCVSDLDLFVNNKLANTKPNQKFGTSNTFRQKLLLEQYYIDILVKILEESLPKQELELWSQKDSEDNYHYQIEQDEETDLLKKKNESKGIIDKKEYVDFIDNKVQLAKLIYQLIIGICKNNPTNELYTFDLIPYFQIHFKYIPESIDCLIEICSKNDKILNKFADNLKIQFDFNKKKAITDDMDTKIKFLINLYDGHEYDTPEIVKQEHIEFRQHEKLISKPLNLINYFMNIIWDDSAQHKKDYLRFLASICITSDHKGISINQENIYKLYKKYNQMKVVIDHERYFVNYALINTNNLGNQEREILSEQLNFYGSLSYGRNFLWKNELEGKIQEQYLISNIWNDNNDIPPIIKAKFCKLALSLFIDHDPLIKIEVPNFCRLFEKLDKKVQLFELDKKRQTMFDTLINEVQKYYQKLYDELFRILKSKEEDLKPDEKGKQQKMQERGYDYLNDKLLLDTTEMFFILMKLNLFEILNMQSLYPKFIHYFLTIFQYHKNNLKFVSGLYMSDVERTRKRIEKKQNKMPNINIGLGGLGSLMGKLKLSKTEEKEEVPGEDIQIGSGIEDGNIYFNPIMRGFIRLNNDLEVITPALTPNQIIYNFRQSISKILTKYKICDIINHFLDLRQDFLITNCLVWFKSVMPGNEKEKNKSVVNSQLTAQDQELERIQKQITELVKQEIKGIFPNISKSGIYEIDEQYSAMKDDLVSGNVFSLGLTQKKTTKFKNYIKNKDYPEFYDIDTMLMHGLDETTIGLDDSQAAIIPKILSSFILIQNEELEKKCLRIITRIFNQRDELRQNILKLQILFSPEQNDLFSFVEEQILQLRHFIERSEVWIQTLGDKNQDITQHDCTQINKILQNITNSLFSGCEIAKIGNKNIGCVLPSSLQPKLDKEKQNISKYLKTYDPILQLIKDGMSHFAHYMMSAEILEEAKILLVKMFSQAFEFLTMFVKQNPENQIILHKHLDQFTGYLRFDLGQIGLICEIFRDNMDLLTTVDSKLINMFVDLIEHEGRQVMFLEFLEVIQKCKNEMIFENQLVVLNQFLSLQNMTERESKLLYVNFVQNNQVHFYFDDVASLQPQDIILKLKEVDYLDTYRDEPFLYHAKLLDLILLSTIELGEDIAEKYEFLWNTRINYNISINKLKKCFQFTYFLSILCEKDYLLNDHNKDKENDFKKQGFTQIKPYIANFTRCVHILSEKAQHHSIPDPNAESMEFSRLIEFELFRLENLHHKDITIEYIGYVFDYILPLFNAYFLKNFELGLLYKLGNPGNRKDLKGLIKFASTLVEKKHIFNNWIDQYQIVQTCQFLNRIDHRITFNVEPRIPNINLESNTPPLEGSIADIIQEDVNSIQVSPDKYIQKKSLIQDKNSVKSPDNYKQMKSVISDKNSVKSRPKGNSVNISKDSVGKIQIDQSQKEDPFGNPKQNAFEIFKLRLQEEELVNTEIDLEKSALADIIINIQKLVKDEYYKKLQPKPDLDLVLKKFISFLIHSMEDPDNKTTIISLLQILRKIIEKEENEDKKKDLQNRFDKLGATQMVLFVISEDHPNLDGDLLINFLLFINVMLEGGNEKVQKTIYEFCVQNTKSELIFQKFYSFISKQIDSLEYKAKKKKNELAKKKLQKPGQEEMIVEEELIQEADEEDSTIKPLDVVILSNVLNFLQMCVEGHNIQMQNYLRNQFNSRTNYDMINAVADLVRTYYYDARTQDMFLNMIKCLDTLSELVQGPCPENQIAVSESKFFDICTDLFSIQNKKEQVSGTMTMKSATTKSKSGVGQKRSNAGLTQWMIERLRNKCLILVLSLLEMRDVKTETQLVKRIIRNLPMNVLERHLDKVYKKFQAIYKGQYVQDCLNHLDQDPDSVKQKIEEKEFEKMYNNDKGYFDFIIQNGFYILFLVSYYMESNERLEGSLVQMFRAQQKKVVSKEKNFIEQLLHSDNIISQLLLFVWNIVESVLKQAQEIQMQAMKRLLKGNNDASPEVKKKLIKQKMEQKKKRMTMAFEFFFNNTAHIDVVRNNKLELVYFVLLPFTKSLPKEKKTHFHEVVDRSNVKSKVQDLVNMSDHYIEICKHEERLKIFFAKNSFLSIFANYVKLWEDLAFILTLLLNLLVLVSFSTIWSDRLYEPRLFMLNDVTKEETMRIFLILGIMMTCCSMFVVIFFLLKNLPLIIGKVWDKQEAKIDKKKQQGIIDWLIKIIINFILIIIQVLQEVEIIYYLAYGALACLGTFIHPFFFVFHLSEVLIRYPTLKSVIKAVYNPREQLGLTFILYLIFIYIFTLWGFVQFHEDYNGECDNLYYCFLLTVDTTFKFNGGIGGWLSEQSNVDDEPVQNYGSNITRIFYDTAFNILVVIILVNIVSGIIIDTFGALRDEENEKNQDIQDKCFICGILKTTFDRQSDPNSGGFTQHIRINHYMWNYMFYITYLRWKKSDDFTGIESYVMEKLKNDDFTWQFKLNQAKFEGFHSIKQESYKIWMLKEKKQKNI